MIGPRPVGPCFYVSDISVRPSTVPADGCKSLWERWLFVLLCFFSYDLITALFDHIEVELWAVLLVFRHQYHVRFFKSGQYIYDYKQTNKQKKVSELYFSGQLDLFWGSVLWWAKQLWRNTSFMTQVSVSRLTFCPNLTRKLVLFSQLFSHHNTDPQHKPLATEIQISYLFLMCNHRAASLTKLKGG